MLFERTCRIKQDFDWFLRFASPNSVDKRKKQQKSSRKPHKKTGSTILSSACLEMFEPSKAFSMFLFMMPANQTASRCNQNQNANDQRRHLPVAFPSAAAHLHRQCHRRKSCNRCQEKQRQRRNRLVKGDNVRQGIFRQARTQK